MESAKRASGNNCVESEFFFFKKRGSKGGKEVKKQRVQKARGMLHQTLKTQKVQFRKKSRIFHSFFFHDAHE
jgi:hypothetical protein